MLLLCCSYVALIGNGTYNGPTTDVQRTYSKTKEAHIHHEYAPLNFILHNFPCTLFSQNST